MSQLNTLVPRGEAGIGTLTTLGDAIKRWYAAYLARRMQTVAMASLYAMSDRDLSDIGLTRGEIESAVRGKAARPRQCVPEC